MPQPAQKPGRSRQDYATPPEFLIAVKKLLGIREFSHDFAADESNTVAATYYSEAENALMQTSDKWARMIGATGWGWLNPPFGHIAPWAQACFECAADGGGHVAFLVPAGVGANWFRDWVHAKSRVLLLNGRLSFNGIAPFPKDCILCLYGPDVTIGYDVWNWRTGNLSVSGNAREE